MGAAASFCVPAEAEEAFVVDELARVEDGLDVDLELDLADDLEDVLDETFEDDLEADLEDAFEESTGFTVETRCSDDVTMLSFLLLVVGLLLEVVLLIGFLLVVVVIPVLPIGVVFLVDMLIPALLEDVELAVTLLLRPLVTPPCLVVAVDVDCGILI